MSLVETNLVCKKDKLSGQIPYEINTHLHNYGVEMWNVKTDEMCDICNSHIDEKGYCRCGVGSVG